MSQLIGEHLKQDRMISEVGFHLLDTGAMLGSAGQRSDSPQSPTDAHGSSVGGVLEWCMSSECLKTCSRCITVGNRVTCVSFTRTGAKFSLPPVTKQPRCGILTATKQCRSLRFGREAAAQTWPWEKSGVVSHLSPYFFTARRPNQGHSLDKSPELQLCHDWKLGQNTEGIVNYLEGKLRTLAEI